MTLFEGTRGQGVRCQVGPTAGPGRWRLFEAFPGGSPDLLSRIDNGVGATTAITLGSAASHWARDRLDGGPRWLSFMLMTNDLACTSRT